MAIKDQENQYEYLRFPMKSKFMPLNKSREINVSNVISFSLPALIARFAIHSTRICEIYTAVNTDVTKPIQSVTPNPLTEPDPKMIKIIPIKIVVTFPSKIALNAFSYPILMASNNPLPERNSSRIRSLISTLASTAIPNVNTIPAIPGKVKAAWI